MYAKCTKWLPGQPYWVSIRNCLKLAFVYSTLYVLCRGSITSLAGRAEKEEESVCVRVCRIHSKSVVPSSHSVQPTCEFRPQKLVRLDCVGCSVDGSARSRTICVSQSLEHFLTTSCCFSPVRFVPISVVKGEQGNQGSSSHRPLPPLWSMRYIIYFGV